MVRIIMMKPPSYMPAHMADFDGFYSLDLNKDERIALTRVIDDYADVGIIKQDTFKDLTLPLSKKNKLLLGAVGNPSALNVDHNKVFDIQLLKTDFSYPVQGLQIVGVTDVDGGGFLTTIFGELNDWYRPMSQLKLTDLDLGSEVVSFAWYSSDLFPNHKWEDDNTPVFTSLVNYGEWFIRSTNNFVIDVTSDILQVPKHQVVFNDYRLWFSSLALLKAAFCQVGYELIAPNLEETEFRQQWTYLLDKDFETANQADLPDRPFDAFRASTIFALLFENSPTNKVLNGVVPFVPGFDTINDPGNHLEYHPFGVPLTPLDRICGSFYRGGVVGKFFFSATTSLLIPSGTFNPIAPKYVTIKLVIRKSQRFGVADQLDMIRESTIIAEQQIVLKGTFFGGVARVSDFEMETDFIKLYQHDVVFAMVEFTAELVDGGGNIITEVDFYPNSYLLDASFSMQAKTQIIEEGDTIDLASLIMKDKTPIDLFKGNSHLNGLKLETDTVNKKVYAYPEFKYNWYKSGLQEGYFKDNADDPFEATPKIQAKSMEQEFIRLNRNAYLKFLDSTDGYIQNQPQEDIELHSKRVDFGDTFEVGENIIENPFFEPTDVGLDEGIGGFDVSVTIGVTRPSAHIIPFLWSSVPSENDLYPSRGYDFAPRILIAYDYGPPLLEPSATGLDGDRRTLWYYEDDTQSNVNLFGQIFPDGITVTGLISPVVPDMANVYGNGRNPLIKDQFTLFYSRMIQQAYFGVVLNFLVKLDLVDFSNISFRRKWKVRYLSPWGEIFFYGRLSRVDDYVIGENITTPVQLISDSNNTSLGC